MQRGLTLGEADWIAQRFHYTYEHLAPNYGYETREASRKRWSEVPPDNRALMIDTVMHLFEFDDGHLVLSSEGLPLPMVGEDQFLKGTTNGTSNS